MIVHILIGTVLFLLLVLAALPFWRRRPGSNVPGAYYLAQTFRDQVIDVWRDFRIANEDYPRHRNDPVWVGELAATFAGVFSQQVVDKYDREMRVWRDDLLAREGQAGLHRAIIIAALEFQYRQDQQALSEALVVALHRCGAA